MSTMQRIFHYSNAALAVGLATVIFYFCMAPIALTVEDANNAQWRLRFLEAAVVHGPTVLLGEVAVPVGEIPEETWKKLAQRELWPSPPAKGKPVNMTRPRLQEAVVSTMNDLAPYCLFPGSLALQRGGAVIRKDELQPIVVSLLMPKLGNMPGESSLREFRLPPYIFLQHAGQKVDVEPQKNITPGRLNFRLVVKELDGKPVQKISASAFLDVWAEVPSAVAPLNKDDVLEPGMVTHVRVNLAHLRENPWDGRGGPWKIMRPIGIQQTIYQSDLGHIPTIRKGSHVTMVYEAKNVRLSIAGEALSDGVPGENIPLRNTQTRKEVYGVVRDSSTVVIGMQQR